MRNMLVLAALLAAVAGCGLLGPTPADVRKGLEAVSNGIQASAAYRPKVDIEYSNRADLSSRSPDGSVSNEARVLMDSAHALFISGTCTFAGYRDKKTGYTLDGTVSYKFDDIKKDDPDAMTGEVACTVTLAGGKVESLEATVTRDKDGTVVTELFANGKKVDLEAWENARQMLKAVAPGLVAR